MAQAKRVTIECSLHWWRKTPLGLDQTTDVVWYLVQPSPSLQIVIAIALVQIILDLLFAQHRVIFGFGVAAALVLDRFIQAESTPSLWRSHDQPNLQIQHT